VARVQIGVKSAAEIRDWLRAAIALELRLDPAALDAQRPFAYYGLDSLTAATLSGELGDWIGREIPPDLLVEHPTIDSLAERLAGGQPAPLRPPRSDRPDGDRPGRGERAVRLLARAAVRASSIVEIEGCERIPAAGPALFAVNHLHILDALWMSAVLPPRTRFLVAEEYRTRFVVGRLLDAGRVIYIARGRADREALERAVAVVRGGGAVAIAPEGRLSRTGGLIKGQSGVAYLSSQSGVPVIPVVAYGQERAGASWTGLSRVRVRVLIGDPIGAPVCPATAHELERHAARIMKALARLLPPAYRGMYGEPGPQ
jgi:1-acyl-sn-glycerol-3-phosphate acyltransferase